MRRSLNDILLKTDSPISQRIHNLVKKAGTLEQLHLSFAAIIPENLKGKIHFANYDDGRLTVTTENAVFSAQARMLQKEILSSMRALKEFRYAYKFDIKVRPNNEAAPPRQHPMVISKDCATLLSQEAGHCDDEEIAAALNALASHAAQE